MFGFCYKVFYKGEALKLNLERERYFEWLTVGTWALSLPCLAITVGALVGGWWAGSFLIETENLGERVGKVAFKTVAAGVVASQIDRSEYEQAKYAKALIAGEEKLSIERLHRFNSHHVGEVSVASLEALVPLSKDGRVRHGAVWAVEKTVDGIAYWELGSQGDVIYELATKMAKHDRETDHDGLVTVEEISDVACKTFLNKFAKSMWAALMLELILPVLAALALLPLLPPLAAWSVRRFLAWRQERKGELSPKTELEE